MMEQWILLYLVVMSGITFLIYGLDKWKAKKNKWRVPEKTLILLAVIGGSVGALLGMKVFRHKTKHKKFTIGVPLILLLQAALVIYLVFIR